LCNIDQVKLYFFHEEIFEGRAKQRSNGSSRSSETARILANHIGILRGGLYITGSAIDT